MELPEARDRRLAEQAAAGDDAAFAALVGRHREALVRFVAQRTGRATIAEDAVQEALLSAHRALRAGEPPRDVKAWLHTIAWRRALDLLRRERPTVDVGAWEDLQTVDGPDVVVGAAAEFDSMLRHWRRLPHRQRHALAMSVLEGRSVEEIGRAFDVSPDAAKSLVARSRRSLARAMAAPRPAPRRRPLLLLPPALVERFREGAVFLTHHEQPVSLATKVCAGMCAVTLAGGGSAAVVATVPPPTFERLGDLRSDERAKPKRQRPAPRPRRTVPRPAAPAPVAPAVTPQPRATAVPSPMVQAHAPAGGWSPAPSAAGSDEGTQVQAPAVAETRPAGRDPEPLATGPGS